MRALAIDLGLKRIGAAISDESGIAIRLLPNISAKNRKETVEQIINLVIANNIGAVIIGCPQELSESSKAIAKRAMGLKETLKILFETNNLSCALYLWDESFSSKKALDQLVKSGVAKKKRKKLLDSNSAAVILEEFLYFYERQHDKKLS